MSIGNIDHTPKVPAGDQSSSQRQPAWKTRLWMLQSLLSGCLLSTVSLFLSKFELLPVWLRVVLWGAYGALSFGALAWLCERIQRSIREGLSGWRTIATPLGAALLLLLALELGTIGVFAAALFDPYSPLDLPRRALGFQGRLLLKRTPTTLSFSGDGRRLAGGSIYGRVTLWPSLEPSRMQQFLATEQAIHRVVFSPNGQLLAVAPRQDQIQIRSAADGALLRRLDGSGRELAFSPDSTLLAATDISSDTHVWRLADGQLLQTVPQGSGYGFVGFRPDNTVISLKSPVDVVDEGCYAFSSDGHLLALGFPDGSIHLLDTTSGQTLRTLVADSKSVESLAFSDDGRLLASASGYDPVRVWQVADGQQVAVYQAQVDARALAFVPGQPILAVSEYGGVTLWRVPTP